MPQLSRLLSALVFEEFLLGTRRWRTETTHFRLVLAAEFSSCPELSVNDVARLVGYGHAQALANAFQRYGLSSPSAMRQATLANPVP